MTSANQKDVALEVNNLRVHYLTAEGEVIAVNGISFKLYKGELLGLVGESGCGKTTAAMGILRLVQPPGRILDGQVIINGETDILSLDASNLRKNRWKEIALVPQGAMNSLNPTMRVQKQIGDAILTHEGRSARNGLDERIERLLKMVGLPKRAMRMYPHELSGGMKQRVCIAHAIALNPTLIVADEPTSALDVIVQRVVAQTLLQIKNELGVSMIMIGHDMGLMAQMADRIAVMYAGNMVEIAPVRAALKEPLHPYTQLLIESIPSIKERKPLKISEGLTHDLRNPPPGCIFQFRCQHVMDKCRAVVPPLQEVKPDHQVACHLYEDGVERVQG